MPKGNEISIQERQLQTSPSGYGICPGGGQISKSLYFYRSSSFSHPISSIPEDLKSHDSPICLSSCVEPAAHSPSGSLLSSLFQNELCCFSTYHTLTSASSICLQFLHCVLLPCIPLPPAPVCSSYVTFSSPAHIFP